MSKYRRLQRACCGYLCAGGSCPDAWKINASGHDWGPGYEQIEVLWKLVYRVGPFITDLRCQWWSFEQAPIIGWNFQRYVLNVDQSLWTAAIRVDWPGKGANAIWIDESHDFGEVNCDDTFCWPLDSFSSIDGLFDPPTSLCVTPWRTDDVQPVWPW